MAYVPPNVKLLGGAGQKPVLAERYKLKIHEIDPTKIIPNGDRYVVEIIDMDEKILLGSILVVTQTAEKLDPSNPHADPTVERRGVLAAVIVNVGNGHLLGLPDPRVAVANFSNPMTQGHPGEHLERVPADVPMFYKPGDVVFIDHTAKGRALMIVGRECRIVNQIDVLGKIDGYRLKYTENGWEPDDA